MRTSSLIRVAVASAVVGAAGLVLAVTPAFATSSPIPISTDNPLFIPLGPPTISGPNSSIDPACSSAVATGFAALEFVDGNGHLYGPTNHPDTNGGNVEGDAYLIGFNDSPLTDPNAYPVYMYFGQAHLWFGDENSPNPNSPTPQPPPGPNAQVQAQTFTFHGTEVDGNTGSITVSGSFGQTTSASNHMSGWGHLKITC